MMSKHGVCKCLQGVQLMELIKLLPEAASNERVELCSSFWARLTDRATTWSDVMRSLTADQQVMEPPQGVSRSTSVKSRLPLQVFLIAAALWS